MLFCDIETIPTTDPSVIDELSKSISAPATHKKPESIEKWMEENKPVALKDLIAKTSLDGLYGSVACIAWAMDDGKVITTDSDMSERECLFAFYEYIEEHVDPVHETLCGHNIAGFDLPFLKHRSMILGIKPPIFISNAMRAKPWDACIDDTMLMWSSDRQKYKSMDKLCKAFGIPGKGDFDGSMVAETWPINPQKVIDYCADDVRRTRELYKRMTFEMPVRAVVEKAA